MIRLKGPIRELLEETATEERAARIEQAVSARRLGRHAPKSPWLPFAAGALAMAGAAAVFALVSSRTVVEKEDQSQPSRIVRSSNIPSSEEPIADIELPLTEAPVRDPVQITELRTANAEPSSVNSSGSKLKLRADAIKSTTVDGLLEAADRARGAGDYSAALNIFAEIYTEYSADPRAGLAAFTAARIEQDTLKHPLDAAKKIEIALQLGLASELREPARARLFAAYAGAGDRAAAARAATDYLEHHPSGERAAEARRIAGVAE